VVATPVGDGRKGRRNEALGEGIMSPSRKASHGHLPATIDPIQLAERGAHLTGTLPLKGMPRLLQAALAGSDDVFVDLAFERGEGENVLLMHGRLHARLRVTCQRCLEPMDLELETTPWLILMRPDERRVLQEENEPDTLLVDKPLPLSDLAEEELLLALPMVPMHELSRCAARNYVTARGQPREVTQNEKDKPNPFSVLHKLKTTK